ncbi:VWA domain-containing protein [Dactylosporangium sp. NPDC000521]|uniref:vWA domain-containing protein n=1 Tax=Dactylosporangium sp. NPDC000521 TaxID=3363975 RepID=UPI0036C6CFD6
MSSARLLRVPLLFLVCAATAGVLAGPAAPARAEDQVPLADVLRALHVDDLPMHYVILIDRSGSMRQGDRYTRAMTSTRAFVTALGARDRLTLASFNAGVSSFWDGPVTGGVGAAVDTMTAQPVEGSTDLGVAIRYGLDKLDPSDTSPAVIVVLTDAQEQPPGGSRYAGTGGQAAWDALRQQAAAVAASRPLRVYPVPMVTAHDADAVLRVFDAAVVEQLGQPATQFQQTLESMRVRARADKAREYLREEHTTVEAVLTDPGTLPLRGGTVRVTLTSKAKYVPLTVSGLDLDVGGLPVTTTAAEPFTLAPGEHRTVGLRVAGHGDTTTVGDAPRRSGAVRVKGTVGSSWAQALTRDIGLRPRFELAGRPGRVGVVTGTGLPVPLVVGVPGALVLLGFGVFAAVRLRRPRMSGELIVTDPAVAETLRIRLQGRHQRLRGGSVSGHRQRTVGGRSPEPAVRVRYRGRTGTLQLRQTRTIGPATVTYQTGR